MVFERDVVEYVPYWWLLYPPALRRHDTVDTMGFPATMIPMDDSVELVEIVSPTPRPLRVHQESLELLVQNRDVQTPELQAHNQNFLGVRRNDAERESGVLGEQNPVRMGPPQTHQNIKRNASQRTMNSESSIGMEMVSDGELDRLGIGMGN